MSVWKMCDIRKIKNFACATKKEQIHFFGSFDFVILDLDGVVWIGFQPLPGAVDCLNNLKKLGKSVNFVSNNTTASPERMAGILIKSNVLIKVENIFTPTLAYITFLKNIKFSKTLFVIGFKTLKEEFKKAGFKVAENTPYPIGEDVESIANSVVDDEEIGAVIMDIDVNLTYIQLQKASTYLKRKDCLFITGAGDRALPFPRIGPLIGNYVFIETIKQISGREPQQLAKPSVEFSNFIKEKLSITDPQKVLFIGDSIDDDMKFATNSGYQKLIVLTGVTKKKDLDNWKKDEIDKPQYYIESLKALNLILEMLQNIKDN
ncbi:uncharacterized protein LOC130447483 [Diorhabda sublineata]|uniref:uncharacterized protein LOC130447483 n=1 Tax=Diorhabda sublineata TaxID=1163346 RepID=UPI0024E0803C|nr:uncharacterized protein LOC130447483 [Diorhabda sublineata]